MELRYNRLRFVERFKGEPAPREEVENAKDQPEREDEGCEAAFGHWAALGRVATNSDLLRIVMLQFLQWTVE